jgi:hypothetical protein
MKRSGSRETTHISRTWRLEDHQPVFISSIKKALPANFVCVAAAGSRADSFPCSTPFVFFRQLSIVVQTAFRSGVCRCGVNWCNLATSSRSLSILIPMGHFLLTTLVICIGHRLWLCPRIFMLDSTAASCRSRTDGGPAPPVALRI